MKKNVAGQKIGAQMTTASDGSDFTGTVTVYVTDDAGTQNIGTVGSGICTHEGNGYHTYAPSQAETNGDLIAFTFKGTGAITATVQIEASFPQTGDNFAITNSGTFGNSALKTLLDAIATYVDSVESRLPAALVSGKMDSSISALPNDVITAASTASDFIAEIKAQVVAAISTDVISEPSAALGATASLTAIAAWLLALSRNKTIETPTLKTLRNFADTANIATATISYNSGTSTVTKDKDV